MAEYIDRQKLIDDFQTAGSCFVYGDYIPAIVSRIKIQPAIDPETMPLVQDLQAQVKEQKEQLSHLEYWELDRKQVLKSAAGDRAAVKAMQKHCEKTISDLRAELKRVTAERDAAISDLKILSDCDYCKYDCKNYEEDDCRFCSVKNASVEPAKTGQAGNGTDLLQKMQQLKVRCNRMTNLERRALLGDRQAQEECTRHGIVLPCPFCGNMNIRTSNWGMWRCWCPECRSKSDDCLRERDAIKQWNTRHAPPIGRCKDCANWYKQHCASGPCATEPTDADFFCGNFEPKTQLKELADLQPLGGVGSKEEAEKNHIPGTAPERRSNER